MLPYNLTPDLVIVQVKSLSALRQLAQRHTDSEKQSQKMSSSFCGPRTGCLSAVLLGLIDLRTVTIRPRARRFAGESPALSPKARLPKTRSAFLGTHLLRSGSNGLHLHHSHLRVLLQRARPLWARGCSHWPGRSSVSEALGLPEAVGNAIATEHGTTPPGML